MSLIGQYIFGSSAVRMSEVLGAEYHNDKNVSAPLRCGKLRHIEFERVTAADEAA